jgi:hypothetical protein
MSVLIGIVVVGFFIWAIYAGYVRALMRKRYTTRQHEPPDLNRFAEGSPRSGPVKDDPPAPGSVT